MQKFLLLLPVVICLLAMQVIAAELSGKVSIEGRLFPEKPLYDGQKHNSFSISAQPEYYSEFDGGSVTFVPYLRVDSADSERNLFDIREAFALWYGDDWEVRAGVGKFFWGVTESRHLVDVINQTDSAESANGEEKLGQPLLYLSLPREWGTFDFFVLPYFRERTFSGRNGRLRAASIVDSDKAIYESGDEERHIDLALRYGVTLGDWEIGLSHFRGTSRDPTLISSTDANGNSIFIPLYEQMEQSGMELQLVKDEWLYKLEAIYRSGQGETFNAVTAGFEYTFTGVFESAMDIGVLSEWLYDSRGGGLPGDNDLMFGMRLAVNDIEGTEALLGVIVDLDSTTSQLFLESSRRINDNWKAELEASFIFNPGPTDILNVYRNDNFFQFLIAYYY